MRIIETIVFIAILIGAVIVTIIPFVVSAGLANLDELPSDQIAETLAAKLLENWILLVYALIVITVVLAVFIAVHAFTDGAAAQVLVDSERAGAGSTFTIDRWMRGGWSSWWRIFWIYNVVWSFACLVMLLPLTVTLVAAILIDDNTARIVVACGGLVISFLVLLPCAVVAAIWTQKAIAIAVARNASATESMSAARKEIMGDFGRHVVIAIIVFAVSLAGSMAISMVGWPLSLIQGRGAGIMGVVAPIQIVISVLQSIFSAAVGTWFLSAYIGLTEER
jgi:hypothetical protein